MEFQQTTPVTKLEHSPAESLMSAPGDNFTSLFAVTTPSATSTMNPMDIMTPQSCMDDQMGSLPIIKEEEGVTSTPSPSPAPEKKTTKKRKSWGQVLPEPKTNLPPRKRAKTADEKEQRRVERVLRNRRAAQSSRERKRQEVEQLEKRNKELEAAMQHLEQMNARIVMELDQFRRTSGLPPVSPQEYLSSQNTHKTFETTVSPTATVDPAALSPCLSPVAEVSEEIPQQEPLKEAQHEQPEGTSPDLTQRPAAMFPDAANFALAPATSDDAAYSLGDLDILPTTFDTDRYIIENGYISSPNSSIIDDHFMGGDAPAFNLNDEFDITEFLHDDANGINAEFKSTDNAAAILSHELQFFEPETQIPSENPIQQPLPGASSRGCDVGGIAVGV
ncbi:Transcriptional activator hac1 [Fusarium austroafricanum]|uniref:Transcriptional activator hac1 n=1 Tax=Fusarium austroafricanum TaxID=2364996 RepID=A0A8H4JKQ1_9HYPO|nr:Transcriptional activator hac1 [Fusarium austroafricanum]